MAAAVWYAMAQDFYRSGEYLVQGRDDTGFVTDLYRTFFDRDPDAGGLAYWTGELSQGLPRDAALASFASSPEFVEFNATFFPGVNRPEVDVVMDFYRGVLGRLPDDGGLSSWIAIFQEAQCSGATQVRQAASDMSQGFLGSSEYTARSRTNVQYVSDLYDAFLGRGGDRAGLQHWVDRLESGADTRDGVRAAFFGSTEFQGRLDSMTTAGCVF
jgi:hypothetical protein